MSPEADRIREMDNLEAERLRDAIEFCSEPDAGHHRKWLQQHRAELAELVDAAMDAVNTGRIEGVEGGELNRLARAVVDFKGTQEPPEPVAGFKEVLSCPEPDCPWQRIATGQSPRDAYAVHYREIHQGGKP